MSSTASWQKPILVTGASGFIGGVVVRCLVAQGRRVRCLLRPDSRTDRIESLPLERVIGDLRDADAVRRAAAGCAAVIHLGGISAWSQIASPLMFPVVVEGTRHVLDAMRSEEVPRLVYVSSAAALGPSRRPEPRDENAPFDERDSASMTYVLAKRAAEQLCLQAAANGLEVVIVNPAEVYGPEDRDLVTAGNLLALLHSGPIFVCPGGTSIVHVNDVADGILRALDHGRSGERYLLGGENLHHRDLAALLIELEERRSPVLTVPAGVVQAAAAVAGFFHLPFPVPTALVPYATRFWFIDNSKARRELGGEFRSARATLADTLAWLRSAGHLH